MKDFSSWGVCTMPTVTVRGARSEPVFAMRRTLHRNVGLAVAPQVGYQPSSRREGHKGRLLLSRTRYPLRIAGVLLLLSVAIAFGWKQAIWPLNQHSELALARRAQRFWDLKLSGDSLGAYQYMAESYRRRITPVGFAKADQGIVVHTGALVKTVRLDESGGVVEIELRHILNKEHFEKSEVTSVVQERWLYENGAWYRWPPGSAARG